MAKISLANVLSGFNLNKINDNFKKIEDVINDRVLFRNNVPGEDNTLRTDIDINGRKLYNLAAPSADSHAARLKDVKNAIAGLSGNTANLVSFSSASGVVSNNVQGAIEEVATYIPRPSAPTVVRPIKDKLREGYISPEDINPQFVSGQDATSALQGALDTGKNVWLSPGVVYGVSKELKLAAANVTITGGGVLKLLNSYNVTGGTLSVLNITGESATLDAVTFDGTGVSVFGSLNNRFVWCTAPRLKVTDNASFINLPKGGTNFNGAIGCNSLAPYASVNGAYFYGNPGAVFFQGRNCVASNNRIINPNDVAIAFNGTNCVGCVAVGNVVDNELLNSCSALIAAEEGASLWVIEANRLSGVMNGTGIAALNVAVFPTVRGGRIVSNIINGGGGVTANPCALISISPYYNDVEVAYNELLGCPTGNSNTRMMLVAACGTQVASNLIDGSSTSGLSALVQIDAGNRGLTFKDNVIRCFTGGRHILLAPGDYNGNPVSFEGGKFFGGFEGINAEQFASSILNIDLRIVNLTDSTASFILNCPTILGDRSDWMNSGAYLRPHRIGVFTEMHGTGVPTKGTFYNGDKIYYLSPDYPNGYVGVIRAQGGWHSFGTIA